MGTRTFAFVVAHPDDDAYGMAGTVALDADDPGFRFVLVHATDGGAGDIRDGFPATRETLGEIRRAECEAAWRVHGRVPDRHEWLGFPNGGLAAMSFDELVVSIAAVLEEEPPTVVGTFGPDGIFGHPDHITVGAATDAALLRSAGSATAAANGSFQRLLHVAVPQSVFERWNQQRAALGLWVFDPSSPYHMRGVPDEEIGLVVDCRSVADRVVAGLREHRSQLHVMSDDPTNTDQWQRRVGREWASSRGRRSRSRRLC